MKVQNTCIFRPKNLQQTNLKSMSLQNKKHFEVRTCSSCKNIPFTETESKLNRCKMYGKLSMASIYPIRNFVFGERNVLFSVYHQLSTARGARLGEKFRISKFQKNKDSERDVVG